MSRKGTTWTLVLIVPAIVLPAMIHATDLSSASIKLPRPAHNGNTSVEHALLERRSVREYKNLPIPLSDLSQLLWAAQGISGTRGQRTAPSAGALYPLEITVVAGAVNELATGIYRYKPEGHGLQKIADGDKRTELSRAAGGQSAVKNAAAVLVISAEEQIGVKSSILTIGCLNATVAHGQATTNSISRCCLPCDLPRKRTTSYLQGRYGPKPVSSAALTIPQYLYGQTAYVRPHEQPFPPARRNASRKSFRIHAQVQHYVYRVLQPTTQKDRASLPGKIQEHSR